MPAARLSSRRRKSSHGLGIFTAAKAGTYGIPPRPVTFAPNVTPVTFNESDAEADAALDDLQAHSPTATLFPPSATPAPPPTRKRCPPGKRRSQGYIPRPPNAFMLFRADFVRQKHVPGTIETNHGSLSKIIGTCWRQLPLEEKRVWELRAKHEKAAHKAMFPDYRFRPVHNKNKNAANAASTNSSNTNNSGNSHHHATDAAARKEKAATTFEDERRCDEVAQLLLEGKKGEELAVAVRNLDMRREMELKLDEEQREQEQREMEFDYEQQHHHHQHSMPPSSHGSNAASPLMLPGAQLLHMPLPMSPNTHMGFGNAAMFASNNMYPPHSSFGQHPQNLGLPQSFGAYHRRSSSVPLPNDFFNMTLPSVPFMQSLSRPESPVASISRHFQGGGYQQQQAFGGFSNPFSSSQGQQQQQTQVYPTNGFNSDFAPHDPSSAEHFTNPFAFASSSSLHPSLSQRSSLGHRRASSAQAMLQSWAPYAAYEPMPMHHQHQAMERDDSPLPDVPAELFSDFSFASASSSSGHAQQGGGADTVDPVSATTSTSTSTSSGSVYDGSPLPAPSMGLDAPAYALDALYPSDPMYDMVDPMYGTVIESGVYGGEKAQHAFGGGEGQWGASVGHGQQQQYFEASVFDM